MTRDAARTVGLVVYGLGIATVVSCGNGTKLVVPVAYDRSKKG